MFIGVDQEYVHQWQKLSGTIMSLSHHCTINFKFLFALHVDLDAELKILLLQLGIF